MSLHHLPAPQVGTAWCQTWTPTKANERNKMPARLEAGRGRVRMLRILKGSSPQQETKTQPQKELLPQQMVPSKVQKSLVLGSVRFQTLSLLYPTPNSSPGPLLLPTRNTLSSQSYLEIRSCLISNWGALKRHAVGAKLTHFYSKMNLEVESGAMAQGFHLG